MKDVQNEKDTRNVPIDRVGVTSVSYPIVVLDPKENIQHTVANVTMAVSLPRNFRGTHMSRFLEVLNEFKGRVTLESLEQVTIDLKKRLNASGSEVKIEFPYFINRKAPVSKSSSYTRYDVVFWASYDENFDFAVKVAVPVHTLCPCSKEISEYGAHNQRAQVAIEVRMNKRVWIEELVAVAESCASSPVYTLLKRKDEKFVTEQAYSNPRFVEDVVREVALKLDQDSRIDWYSVSVVSQESIHNHDAFASLVRDKRR